MTDFSERLAALSPEQRALFELRRKQKGLSEAQHQTIGRRKPAPHYQLSFDQMRLWFLYQLAPNNSAYNITGGVRLTGLLNPDVLERSLNEIIRRHEILRTTFANIDEQPVQVIAPQLTIKITHVDLSHLPEAERAIAMPRVATEHAQVPFDLINGPLIRASLLRLAEDDHVLITTMHHIVTDRWSYTLFEQELAILYHAFSSRLPSPLPELPIQFADFAIWQQQWMQSQKMQEQLDFWKRKLANLPPIHQIPTDHPRPTVVSFLGGRQEVELPLSSVQGVRSLARQSGATIFITLLTMFKVLVARQSGQTDIIVGTPIANRGRPELEKLIGFFLNTLIFRSDLSQNPTFREYLAQVREIASEAYAHQDVPFERLVAELRPERDTSRNPLYQISFLFLDFEDPQELADLPGVKVKTIDVDTADARFDLTFALWSGPDSIYGVFEYSSDLFDPPTIAAFAEHFKLLVAEIVANPDRRVFDIPCLTQDEERKLLVDWNATTSEYPQDRCVHELIAEQAARTPESVAVVFAAGTRERVSLSYGELDARANQLAHHLRSLGVKRETRVGVYLQRSPDLLVTLLGILKASGTYVPLDPSYPPARLEYMLADAGIGVLVTQESLAENLPHTGATLCLDRDADQIAAQPTTPPSSALQAEDLAYIIYTSGSTGQPKGVQIPHRALVNFLHSMRREPGMSAHDTLLAVTTIAFDIAGLELFLPLTVGARIVLVDRDTAIDGARLTALLAASGATIMQATPATWRLLLAAGWAGTPGLRALSGGEALPWDLAQHLLPRVDQLWNLYGPTETTIWSAATRVRAEDGRISLGQPIANTRLYVLDPQQRPVPVGVVGELYIGGAGVARGYNQRPDLTAERFVPDPFGPTGSRLYHTGDLVRYRYDGTLEFSGRADQQIKLRGYRIELGEIEAALREQPEIRDVAVMVREDRTGDQRLVAYVVGEPRTKNQEPSREQSTADSPRLSQRERRVPSGRGGEGHSERLSMALRARLPEYMVPSAFVFLDALPLTPNGKLDRKALPAPDARSTIGGAMVAPRNPTEELVAGVWSAALSVEQIGVHDNFFALGGHSLMATQVVGRVKQLLNLDLPLRLLFEAPTVATFAARLQAEQTDAGARLQPVPRDGTPLPQSFAQQRLWFLDQLQPNSTAYNLLTAARLHGSLNLEAFRRSLATIVQRHESLRTTFTQRVSESDHLGPPVQVIAPTLEVPLNVVSIQTLPEAEREVALMRIVRDEVDRPFDLQQGPLIRAQLVQLHSEGTRSEHVLLLTIHHIVTDGWSQNILLRELTTLYQGFVEHEPATLPELPIQYADYAIWQRNWLSGEVLEQQIDYWRKQLANSTSLDLPTDYPRPPVMTYAGARVTFQIAPELSTDLQQLSQQLGATLFMTLLAAFQSLLSRYSGQTDVAVGTPIAGRVRPELEDLIGFFVNTLVLRTDLSGQPTFAEVVERVRAVSLGAYAHQELPFEVVVERLQPARDLSRSPLFQVMFALQNMPRATIELPDLTLEPIAPDVSTTQFDLSLTLAEEAGGLYGHVEYRTDLFAPATIAQLIEHYRLLLTAVVANPQQAITTLPLLTETERRQLLVDWNATNAAYPEDQCLHQLVEAQVTRTPEAIALRCGDATMTYAQLNTRANQLAHQLQALSVGPDTRVGLCMERSLDLVVGMLGILKAGAAYLPIDPAYPQERIAFLLADAQLGALVTEAALSTTLPPYAGVTVRLDADAEAIAQQPATNPQAAVAPQHLAYVIYTSGSTGKPKGVLVEHRQVVNTLWGSRHLFGFAGTDVLSWLASASFDIAVFEVFLPLLVGGTTLIVQREEILDLPRLNTLLQGCTLFHAVPTLLRQIVQQAGTPNANVRRVFIGGEAVPPDLLAATARIFPQAQIEVLYGPTEATILCTHYAVPSNTAVTGQPIGQPMPNHQIRLYDSHGQLVPVGVAGEIYVGGAGVTRGYLNRPELTATQFVTIDGQRWYRSGDLARWRHDGTLEFLGRVDDQVKVRGYRIELGEIEAAIRQHSAIRDAAVVVRKDRSGDPRLVGYVVPAAVTATGDDQAPHMAAWQTLYDEAYAAGQPADPTFNITGWHSSYTGQPFPAGEMRAWRDATVERIRALQPSRVLEIGVGTGLLLFPLAGDCNLYHGIDFSAQALAHIRQHLPPAWTHVTRAQRRADDLADFEPASFDTVILNSVAQYFPSADYLVTVITQALRLLPPDGRIFIGDVRSRPLLDAFATAITLALAAPDADRATLAAQQRQLVAQERELLLDPAFFHALKRALPQISEVQVEIKRGLTHNELTQFRYDVTLTVDGPPIAVPSSTIVDWSAQRWTLDDLRATLAAEEAVDSLLVRAIPSARVQPLVQAAAWLHDATGPATVAELRATLEELVAGSVDPEALWALGAELGYHVRIGWSGSGTDGGYDAVFNRAGEARLPEPELTTLEPWSAYATTPAATRALAEIAPRLREFLHERLPEYMVPSAFVVLDTLPLTTSGKIDRKALPDLDADQLGQHSEFVAPRTPTEIRLTDIWAEVLHLEQVGIHDDFFALGGHSLLATQVVARIRELFQVELAVRTLFEHPTIAGLAQRIEQEQWSAAPGATIDPDDDEEEWEI